MSSESVATFFSIMLVVALPAIAVAAISPRTRPSLIAGALPLSATIAVGATLGSLYFSEVADFVPCELCWFQRIAMYPLAVVLPMAVLRREPSILRYALPLSAIGLAVSAYHVQLQAFPDQSSFCELSNPCTAQWVEGLGFMTIPRMAMVSFTLISLLAALTLSFRQPEVSR